MSHSDKLGFFFSKSLHIEANYDNYLFMSRRLKMIVGCMIDLASIGENRAVQNRTKTGGEKSG